MIQNTLGTTRKRNPTAGQHLRELDVDPEKWGVTREHIKKVNRDVARILNGEKIREDKKVQKEMELIE